MRRACLFVRWPGHGGDETKVLSMGEPPFKIFNFVDHSLSQAEAGGLYDVTTNARAGWCACVAMHARCARHVDFAGLWPFGASRVVFPLARPVR